MTRRFFTLLLILPQAATAAGMCGFAASDVIGSWARKTGPGFFEVMSFEQGELTRNLFNSWLHERPELIGASWSIESCRLIVRPAAGDPLGPFEFVEVQKNGTNLRLREATQKEASVYEQIIE